MTTFNDQLEYIQSNVIFLGWEIYYYVRSWCTYDEDILHDDYLLACIEGDIKKVERALKKHEEYDKNEGLVHACAHGCVKTAEFLVKNGATDLDRGLRSACMNNRYTTAEFMAKKGANINVGLRHSTSNNITRMLYRHLQGTKIIN